MTVDDDAVPQPGTRPSDGREPRRTDTFRAWTAVHGITIRWCGSVVAAWLGVSLFAAVTVPIKYPFEAVGTVVDSGVIVGLVVPIAVMGTVLHEGPRDLVAAAARSLLLPRLALLGALYTTVAVASLIAALLASLPVVIVIVNSLLLAALLTIAVSFIGVGLGWILPVACTFVFSAPGLIPWDYNAMYRRDVSGAYVGVLVTSLVIGAVAYATRGSRDRVIDRSVQE